MFPLRRWTRHDTSTSGEKSVTRASFNGFFDRANCTANLTGIENLSICKRYCKSRLDFSTNLRYRSFVLDATDETRRLRNPKKDNIY